MAAFTALSLALSLAGTATQIFGKKKAADAGSKASIEAGLAQQRAAESQAGLDEYNAQVADLQATDAVARGAQQEQHFRSSVRSLIGSQTADTAASNIQVGSGSAVDVRADTAFLGELDSLQIRTNAAREAWGYKVQGTDLRMRADIARREGADAARAGQIQAAGIKSSNKLDMVSTVLGAGSTLLAAKYGFDNSAKASPAPKGYDVNMLIPVRP